MFRHCTYVYKNVEFWPQNLSPCLIVQKYLLFFGTVHTRREHTATRTSSRTYCTNRTDIVCYAPARCEETLLGSACRFAGLATVSFACGGTKTESIGVNKNSREYEKYRRRFFRKNFRLPPIDKQQAIRLSAPRPCPGKNENTRDVGVWLFWWLYRPRKSPSVRGTPNKLRPGPPRPPRATSRAARRRCTPTAGRALHSTTAGIISPTPPRDKT